MIIENVIHEFKSEKLAVEAFKQFRLKTGIACKKCGLTHHYWLKSKGQFQCKSCRFRTTLKSGTVLEGCKLPLSYFFITSYLLLKNENKVNIEDIKKYTDHQYYDPLWDYLKKMKLFIERNEKNNFQMDLREVINKFFNRSGIDSDKQIELDLNHTSS